MNILPGEPSKADLEAIEQDSVLDDLWAEVAAERPARKTKVERRDPNKLGAMFDKAHSLFYDPKNWERTHGVALFHKETQSILGNFSEYIHTSVKGCSRLVRESAPITVTEVREVTGDWWIGADRLPMMRLPEADVRPAMLKLHLPELNAWCPLAEVKAIVQHGGIARCELASETQFADSDGLQLLTLPAGTNVLPVMTLDGKITLRQEIGL